MKTIAIFSGYYLPHVGGVERYTHNLSKKLSEMGYKVSSSDYIEVEGNSINEKEEKVIFSPISSQRLIKRAEI